MTNDQLNARVIATLYLLSALIMMMLSIQNYRYGLYDLVYSGSCLMILFFGASAYAQFAAQENLLTKVSQYLLSGVAFIIVYEGFVDAATVQHWAYPICLLSFTCLTHRNAMALSGILGACVSLLVLYQKGINAGLMFAATYALLISLASTYAQLHQQRSRTLVELEIHDSSTGAYNARHLEETLKKEICRADRTGRPLSLIALEIDYFPQVVEVHGTNAATQLSQQLSETLKAMIRAGDSEYFDSNNVFYLLLPCTPSEGVLVIAERIRRTIEESSWPTVDAITVSIGCTSYLTGQREVTHNSLINDANVALVEAQKNGHNRVNHHG